MTARLRLAGVGRSLAIYHGIPFRQRRLRRLYAAFVAPGDLVFDLGAHAGNRTRALAALGCRVVAVEPQPDFARLLRVVFRRTPQVTVVAAAMDARPGRAQLAISDATPTVSTLAEPWRQARAQEPGFRGVQWNRRIVVETTTLDALIRTFGPPRFVKMDVEGAEAAVLEGLTAPIPALSFEYLPWTPAHLTACVARLETLGRYLYNWSSGETYRLGSRQWLTAAELPPAVAQAAADGRAGDVYARLA